MGTRRLLLGLVIALAFLSVPAATAGGPFQQIVGVGADGTSHVISLQPTGARSEAVLRGRAVAVPGGGYVRVYPSIGGLPGDPGRYYPASRVLCLYWREPHSGCFRLGTAGVRLLAPLAQLPLRRLAPTAPVEVRYRSRPLRYANGNIFAALELALERTPVRRSAPPPNAVRLAVSWRGPFASRMPRALSLTPIGVYTSHKLYALPRGPWCYLAGNLPHPSAVLIETTSRVCR
jgi:hypothetical protein